MAKHVAWSDIHAHDGEKRKVIKRGEEVSQDSLGVDDDEWASLVEGGSVRTERFPDDLRPGETPTIYRYRKANEAMLAAEAEGRGDSEAANVINGGDTSAGATMGGAVTPEQLQQSGNQ